MALQTSRFTAKKYAVSRFGSLGRLVFMLAIAVFLLGAIFSRVVSVWSLPSDLRIWFFDVGQGDATLIVTPHGKQVLIDGGPGKRILSKLGETMPPWDRDLDAVVLTHPDGDHLTGLVSVLDQYRIGTVFESVTYSDTATVRAFEHEMESQGIPRIFWFEGDEWNIDGVQFKVVSPAKNMSAKEDNNRSVVLLVTYGNTSVLLPGDATSSEEESYGLIAGDVDVLHVAHHGSQYSTSESLLAVVKPEAAVVSVGAKNRYGHPHPRVLERLSRAGSALFRTDNDGDVLLLSSGGEPSVQPFPLPF